MIQCQVLNAILDRKDTQLLSANNITQDFFSDYKDEYKYIVDHINKYNTVPDKETFLSKFPNFDIINVNEPNQSLIDALYSDKIFRTSVYNFNDIRDSLNSKDIQGLLHKYQRAYEQLSKTTSLTFTDIVSNTQERYDTYLDKCNNLSSYYVTTGFPELDKVIGGWDRKEDYVTIVAKSNTGKTFILLKSALCASIAGLRVGIYSGEMSANKVGYRIDTLATNISNYGIMHGDINLRDSYKEALDELQKKCRAPIFVLTPKDIGGLADVNTLRAFISKAELDILFIDQHSLLEDVRGAKDSVTKASNVSKDLKTLQSTTGIPLITVSQQNRTKLDEGGKKTDTIAQTDRIGQDSTIVIFLEYDNNVLSMILSKSRDSAKDLTLKYAWDINFGKFIYMPESDDATGGDQCDDLKKHFDECDGEDDTFN